MEHGSIHLSLASIFVKFCATFTRFLSQVCDFLHKLYKSTYKFTHKNYVLAPIVGKDLEQKIVGDLF